MHDRNPTYGTDELVQEILYIPGNIYAGFVGAGILSSTITFCTSIVCGLLLADHYLGPHLVEYLKKHP